MKQVKTNKLGWLLALAAMALWCGCTLWAQRVEMYGGVSVRWNGEEGMTPSQVIKAERYAEEDGEQFPPSATLWRENAGQTIRLAEGNAAGVTVTELFGSPEALYPLGFASGGWPLRGEETGCALDEETALRLWGSTDVVGMPLIWGERTYTVRGVFRGGGALMVVQGAEDGEKNYSGLLLQFTNPSAVGGREAARRYLNGANVTGGDLLDLDFLAWGLGALSALPGLLLAGGICLKLLRRGLHLRGTPLLLLQYIPAALLGMGVAVWAAGFPWSVPDRLIPTKFSDFEFWTRILQEFGDTLKNQLSRIPASWDLELWGAVLACVGLAAGTLILLVPGLDRLEPTPGKGLILPCLGAGVVLFALAVGLDFSPQRGMWLLPSLWLICGRCLEGHRLLLMPKERRLADETPVEEETAKLPGRAELIDPAAQEL